MTTPLQSTPDGSGPQTVEVRNHAGDLVRRIHSSGADDLVRRGLGEWNGRGGRRYVRLGQTAPTLPGGWRGGSHTTERNRNAQGVIIGPPRCGLKHKLNRD
jgi:hypothetical protein